MIDSIHPSVVFVGGHIAKTIRVVCICTYVSTYVWAINGRNDEKCLCYKWCFLLLLLLFLLFIFPFPYTSTSTSPSTSSSSSTHAFNPSHTYYNLHLQTQSVFNLIQTVLDWAIVSSQSLAIEFLFVFLFFFFFCCLHLFFFIFLLLLLFFFCCCYSCIVAYKTIHSLRHKSVYAMHTTQLKCSCHSCSCCCSVWVPQKGVSQKGKNAK